MYEGLTNVFWGIFIATFSINLGPIKILPAFVGFIIISSGINTINIKYPNDGFKKALDFSRIMIVIALLGGVINIFTQGYYQHSLLLQIWPIILMTFELLMFNYFFMGIIKYFDSLGNVEVSERMIGNSRIYMIIFIIDIVVLSFVMLFNLGGLNTISAIIFVILRISLMVNFGGLRKVLIPENPDDSQGI